MSVLSSQGKAIGMYKYGELQSDSYFSTSLVRKEEDTSRPQLEKDATLENTDLVSLHCFGFLLCYFWEELECNHLLC